MAFLDQSGFVQIPDKDTGQDEYKKCTLFIVAKDDKMTSSQKATHSVAQVSLVFATEREKRRFLSHNDREYIIALVVMIHHILSLCLKQFSSTRSKKTLQKIFLK